MKITFQHPPTGTANQLIDFDPFNQKHYPQVEETGVYIYGVRAKVDRQLKFLPIVVGEGQLYNRLYKNHYLGKFVNPLAIILGDYTKTSGDAKELWDFSKYNMTVLELLNIYKDIDSFDKALGKRGKISHVTKLHNLIFFQDRNFFHLKHSIPPLVGKTNLKIEESITYLIDFIVKSLTTSNKDIIEHTSRIILTLASFKDRYYYVYASANNNRDIDFTDKNLRKSIEKETKHKLKKINIHTSADGRRGSNIDKIKIDLSVIQNELVNIGEHVFNNPNGKYKNPLILT